uniref:Putative secreted protein n=1 Tax=Anopheles darlingi TaxID=43151 RepID=A0A2M4DR82_ANODA
MPGWNLFRWSSTLHCTRWWWTLRVITIAYGRHCTRSNTTTRRTSRVSWWRSTMPSGRTGAARTTVRSFASRTVG